MAVSPGDWFAVTAPGLEEITAAELRDLRMKRPRTESGGVSFRGELVDGLRANLWLRTATRVLLRVGSFRARTLQDLERLAGQVAWRTILPGGAVVQVRASCARSRIYHSGAAAERIARGIARSMHLSLVEAGSDWVTLGEPGTPSPGGGAQSGRGKEGAVDAWQRVQVRIHREEVTLSLDASGERLHRRGYRRETGKAPLRETLAAALLRAAGWRGRESLVDPFAGSGTLVIEAALLAARIPPGRRRHFAMEQWPRLAAGAREALDAEADARRRPVSLVLAGADRDAGAVRAARANARRAGVAEHVSFEQRSLSEWRLGSPPGLLVCNPPYGRRLGKAGDLRDLYAALGGLLDRAPDGWQLGLVTAARRLARATGLPLEPLGPPVAAGGLTVYLLGWSGRQGVAPGPS